MKVVSYFFSEITEFDCAKFCKSKLMGGRKFLTYGIFKEKSVSYCENFKGAN